MMRSEWEDRRARGIRWAIWRGVHVHPEGVTVRIVSWSAAGARVRFPDGRVELTHPDYLHAR